MSALTPSQQGSVRNAREALDTSYKLGLGTATVDDLLRNIGRLEIALEQALLVIDEIGQGTS